MNGINALIKETPGKKKRERETLGVWWSIGGDWWSIGGDSASNAGVSG